MLRLVALHFDNAQAVAYTKYVNKLSAQERQSVIVALVEGNSIRSTCRMTGVAKGTVLRLLVEIGKACDAYQDAHLNGLYCRRVQCDEVWTFCHAKAKNVSEEKHGQFGYGDVWTWVALDADSKLAVCWHLGLRTPEDAIALMTDLASRPEASYSTHD